MNMAPLSLNSIGRDGLRLDGAQGPEGRGRALRRLWKVFWGAVLGVVLNGTFPGAVGAVESTPAEKADAFWKAHVEVLLKDHCSECHQPSRTKGGLDLSTLQTMLKGGESGPALVPGHPNRSKVVEVLDPKSDPHMPPGKRRALTAEEADLIRTWISKLPVIHPGTGPDTSNEPHALDKPVSAGPPRVPLAWKPSNDMAPPRVIDRFLTESWNRDGIKPSGRASDETFARRVYMDLAGRPPGAEEMELYLRQPETSRRSWLVDAILDGADYPLHMREVFDVVLMGRKGGHAQEQREKNQWYVFLESAFRENRPWNEVVRDFIVARPTPDQPSRRGAIQFLYERKGDPQAMAEGLAPIVYGVQIQCAQCHDHMVAREIKQAHYWGMVAAFNRSKSVDSKEGPGVSESAIGGHVSFANLKKESQPALLTFFNGKKVEEKRPDDSEKELDQPGLYRIPPPKDKEKPDRPAEPLFSRRAAFAETATQNNPLLSRAMVNRVWAMLMGRGLVHPVDLMDSKHPPSHPELLDWLSQEFAARGHDVKWLMRTVCETRVYQSDHRMGETGDGVVSQTRPKVAVDAFTAPLPKPLSAEQWTHSLLRVTRNLPDQDQKVAGKPVGEMKKAFISQFPDLFVPDYNATLQQAMFLSNGPWLEWVIAPRPGNLTEALIQERELETRVRRGFQAVYGRQPDAEEIRVCAAYLKERSPEEGTKQWLWAMLTSAEFQLSP